MRSKRINRRIVNLHVIVIRTADDLHFAVMQDTQGCAHVRIFRLISYSREGGVTDVEDLAGLHRAAVSSSSTDNQDGSILQQRGAMKCSGRIQVRTDT